MCVCTTWFTKIYVVVYSKQKKYCNLLKKDAIIKQEKTYNQHVVVQFILGSMPENCDEYAQQINDNIEHMLALYKAI